MNILIVGGAGYIGSHMIKYLRDHSSHEVLALDNLNTGFAAAVQNTELIVGDCGDQNLVESLCRERGITALMHFGAHTQVGESVTNPDKYYENNVVKGKHLIDAALAAGVKHVIFSSTAAVYGEPDAVPIPEGAATHPTNAYGHTKLTFENLLESYRIAYGLSYTCLRYFNAAGADPSGTIGEAHTPESHLIPLVLQVALGQRASIKVFGTDYPTPDGTCIRDYIHVTDLVASHLLALERLADGAPSAIYNLGNGQGFSVQDVIQVCREVTGHPIPVEIVPRRAGDPALLIASSERAQAALGWTPQRADIREIVATAWGWHQRHPHGYADVASTVATG